MANKMLDTSKSAVISETLTRATLLAIPPEKSGKRKRNSLEPALASTSARSASQCNALQQNMQRKKERTSSGSSSSQSKKKKSKGAIKSSSVPRSSTSASSQKKSEGKITKKDQNMHRCVFEEGGLPEGAVVGYYSQGKKLLEGSKKGLGILCHCCYTEVSASQFEAHAGCASRKKPYNFIYTSNGVSLHEYAVFLKHRNCATKDHDDLCSICSNDGDLVHCDGCPRAFHKECTHLQSVPCGKWYCKYCENMIRREKFVKRNANAVAAGRVSGIDSIEEITKRCIRIVEDPTNVVIACFLCRGCEYNKDFFGPTTSIICDQCEKEYHVECLKKNKMANLKRLPKRKWYCSADCKKMSSDLMNLVKCEPQTLPDNPMDLMTKKQIDTGLGGITDSDVRWRLLNGKISRQSKSLLSQAFAIFHECFDPLIDPESGKDIIRAMVYCKNIRDQYYGGIYSAVLTVNSVIVSAGILRVFGQDLAELPLVATNKCDQGKGYFQALFSCIEKLLISLKVKKIILPAADGAESMWINKFGFIKLSPLQIADLRENCPKMFTFQGTSMLEKELPPCQSVKADTTSSDLSVGVDDQM